MRVSVKVFEVFLKSRSAYCGTQMMGMENRAAEQWYEAFLRVEQNIAGALSKPAQAVQEEK